MIVADYLLQRLAKEGVTHVFTLYGGAISELMDAFTRQSTIKYIVCHHEQACIFAAEGYAKAKGVPGAVLVTSGPGGGNIVTGLQNCYYDSTPLIAITGQVSSNLIRPPKSKLRQLGFQETPIVEIVRPVTKFAATIAGPVHAMFTIETAIKEATGGRPGPVVLDIPLDVQKAEM